MAEKEKSVSGMGEFWDNWLEEDKQKKEKIKELIKKRKEEAGIFDSTGKDKSV